jgi:hypothetical protein
LKTSLKINKRIFFCQIRYIVFAYVKVCLNNIESINFILSHLTYNDRNKPVHNIRLISFTNNRTSQNNNRKKKEKTKYKVKKNENLYYTMY